MNINFIVTDDIQQTLERGSNMVQIKCGYCNNSGLINNHTSGIIDYIKSGRKLHNCVCGIETKVHPEELSKIKKILGAD